MTRLTTIGFDADDTLWHNETFFHRAKARFAELMQDRADPAELDARLIEAEWRNLRLYGYGVKGFTLSMLEAALEITGGDLPGTVTAEILAAGREMLDHPVDLLPHAREAVAKVAGAFRVVLITKGDLAHQERKLERSGLADLFHGVEIVSEKTPEIYARVFARHGHGPERALMVGNSLRSDVLPVIEAGGWGVHVPQGGPAWALEAADPPHGHARFRELPDLSALPRLLAGLAG
ncbi:MAG: HAD family hydrolase [Gemmobacter sp.]